MKAASAPPPSVPPDDKKRQSRERRRLNFVMGLMVAALTIAVLYPHVLITVPPGHAGVLWKRLTGLGIYCWCVIPAGTVLEPSELREEGLHIIWPWDILFLYDLRLQTMTRPYNAISKEGVSLTASISTRYQLQHDSVAQVHKFIGPQYPDVLVAPVIGSRARQVIAQFPAEDVYSTLRNKIQEDIGKGAQGSLADQLNQLVQKKSSEQLQAPTEAETQDTRLIKLPNKPTKVAPNLSGAINILDTPVLGIELPPSVVGAINRKIEQLYIAQEYDYRVDREKLETRRKAIEAAGIRDFQQTVTQGISDSYLRWRGIEATLQLAQSNNAKIVIIGSGKDGLPIILGNVDPPVQPQAGAGATPDAAIRVNPQAIPLERAPAPGLPTPGQKPPEAAPAPVPPEKPQSLLPQSLSEFQSMISRFPGSVRSTGPEPGSSPP